MICEFKNCKHRATQADTYLNAWLCDDHYSYIGTLTGDYQGPVIDWDQLDALTGLGII